MSIFSRPYIIPSVHRFLLSFKPSPPPTFTSSLKDADNFHASTSSYCRHYLSTLDGLLILHDVCHLAHAIYWPLLNNLVGELVTLLIPTLAFGDIHVPLAGSSTRRAHASSVRGD